MKCKFGIITFVTILLFVACGRTKPQTPSNKQATDTVAIALVEMNQRMAEQADEELTKYVLETGEAYVLNDFGFWYRYTNRTQNPQIQKEQFVTVHYRVLLIDGTMCKDVEQTVQVAKKQLPPVIEIALLMLRSGESIELLSPWYLAYGQQGNEQIPPYTSVRIEMEVNAEINS